MSDYARELETAMAAVRAASQVCRSVQAAITPDVLEKKDRSPVTVADFASQAVVCRALAESFPEDPVIGEEDAAELRQLENSPFLDRISEELRRIEIAADAEQICHWIDRGGADRYSGRFWTLDPIDGTKGFLRGEQYAVALALVVDGRVAVGVLGCPNLGSHMEQPASAGTMLTAVRGSGSRQQALDGSDDAPVIHVTETRDPAAARFCESVESGHSAHDHAAEVARLLNISKAPVRLDSQAKYAVVARGEADLYLRLPTRAGYREKIWDHAAGVLIVEEAGGTVTDVAGCALEFTHGSQLEMNRGVVVSNGGFHDRVIAALRECGVE